MSHHLNKLFPCFNQVFRANGVFFNREKHGITRVNTSMSERHPQIAGRVTPATKQEFNAFRDRHGGINQSEALRRLVEKGLDSERSSFHEELTRVDLFVAVSAIVLAEYLPQSLKPAAIGLLVLYFVGLYLAHRYDVDVGRSA